MYLACRQLFNGILAIFRVTLAGGFPGFVQLEVWQENFQGYVMPSADKAMTYSPPSEPTGAELGTVSGTFRFPPGNIPGLG
jgi:hypothetical protein